MRLADRASCRYSARSLHVPRLPFRRSELILPRRSCTEPRCGRGSAAGHRVAMAANGSKEQLFARVSSSCAGLIARIALSYEPIPRFAASCPGHLSRHLGGAAQLSGRGRGQDLRRAIAQKRCISHVRGGRASRGQVELSGRSRLGPPAPDEMALSNEQKRRLVESSSSCQSRSARRSCSASKDSASRDRAILGITANAAMMRCQRAKTTLRALIDKPPKRRARPALNDVRAV